MPANSQPSTQLIRALAQGKSIPATDIPKEFLQEMATLGIEIHLEKNSYKFKNPPQLLYEQAIRSYIDKPASEYLTNLEIHWTIGSTNDYLANKMHKENCHGRVCLAEQQTSGKGRRGRTWVSPFGRNLYMSIGWLIPKKTKGISTLSLVVGIEIAELLRELGFKEVSLKWPNDLLLDSAKLGGILTEMVLSTDNHGMVIGIGINFELGIHQRSGIDQPVGCIPKDRGIKRDLLTGKILNRLLPALNNFPDHGFSPYLERWEGLNLFQNQIVNIYRGDEAYNGIDRGIDKEGNLILESKGKLLKFNSGEVSLRPG